MELKVSEVLNFEEALANAQRKAREKAEKATWATVQSYSKELQSHLRSALSEKYSQFAESEYYDRTGEFANAVSVTATQGHGSFGVHIWFDNYEIHAIVTAAGKFNAHADWSGNPISLEELVAIEDEDKAILLFLEKEAVEYTNQNFGYKLKLTVTQPSANFEDF